MVSVNIIYTKKDLLKLKKLLKYCKSQNRVVRIRGRLGMNRLRNKFSKLTLKRMIKEVNGL